MGVFASIAGGNGCVRPGRTPTGNREELLHVALFAHLDAEHGGAR